MRSFYVYVTLECNLKCYWCYSCCHIPNNIRLNSSTIDAIVNWMKQNIEDKFSVVFTGGEPLLYPDLITDFVVKVRDLPLYSHSSFLTNGSLLDKEILRHLLDLGLTRIAVSCGRDRKVDENILANIPYINERSSLRFIMLTIFPENLDYLEESNLFNEISKFDFENLNVHVPLNANWDDTSLEKLSDVFTKLGTTLADWTFRTGKLWNAHVLGVPFYSLPNFKCPIFNKDFVPPIAVSPKGNLYRCLRAIRVSPAGDEDSSESLGNVFDDTIDLNRFLNTLEKYEKIFPCFSCNQTGKAFWHELCPITFNLLVKKVGLSKAKFLICRIHKALLHGLRVYLEKIDTNVSEYLKHVSPICNSYNFSYIMGGRRTQLQMALWEVENYEKLYFSEWQSKGSVDPQLKGDSM